MAKTSLKVNNQDLKNLKSENTHVVKDVDVLMAFTQNSDYVEFA